VLNDKVSVEQWGVAVVGWEWYQSTEESRAVRMVQVRMCINEFEVVKCIIY
jgi:hypothetical protein